MALGNPSSNQGFGSMSDMTLQEQLARLYAMSQALRQQSGFGSTPMQAGMQTGMQPYQPQVMPMQPQIPQMPMPQQGGGDMMSMLPMLMMMMGRGQPGLGRSGGFQPGMIGTIPGIY